MALRHNLAYKVRIVMKEFVQDHDSPHLNAGSMGRQYWMICGKLNAAGCDAVFWGYYTLPMES